MSERTCSIGGCILPARSRGMCPAHYMRVRRDGDPGTAPVGLMKRRITSLEDRFWAKVDRRGADECWPWMGSRDKHGYGYIGLPPSETPGRSARAHRVAYEITHGPIPEGLHLDHLCRNTSCVNPAHLEAVTQKVNTLRGISFSAVNATKTHCPQGHSYDDENTYMWRGARICRACRRERRRSA